MASVYILGAGAMGSLWATHLHLAFKTHTQHSLQFLSTRANSPKSLKFTLNSPFLLASKNDNPSELAIEIPLIKSPYLNQATRENPNIILICTKSYHALDACLALKPYLNEHCYLVLFQNGLGSQYSIIEMFQSIPIYAAVSTEAVNRQSEGRFVHAGKGLTRIGPLNEKAKEASNFESCIHTLTHTGLVTQATENIWQALWEKLAINCSINPFTAILNCPNGEIKHSQLFQESWANLKHELSSMLTQAGIKTNQDELEQKVFAVIENTRSNISSMLQDMRANRKTEIDDINGFAARYLEEHGLDNRVNTLLYNALKTS